MQNVVRSHFSLIAVMMWLFCGGPAVNIGPWAEMSSVNRKDSEYFCRCDISSFIPFFERSKNSVCGYWGWIDEWKRMILTWGFKITKCERTRCFWDEQEKPADIKVVTFFFFFFHKKVDFCFFFFYFQPVLYLCFLFSSVQVGKQWITGCGCW